MRPNNERSRRLIIFLWIYTAVEVLSGFSHFLEYRLLNNISAGQFTMQEVASNDLRQMVVAAIEVLLNIAVIITFIQWFRRAYYNLHQVSGNLSYSEGWASGAWFVPFMNLARPFTIMKEMVSVSETKLIAANLVTEDESRKKTVGLWWTLWLVLSIGSNINARISIRTDDIHTLIGTSLADIILSFMFIPLTLVTVKMIRQYAELEEQLPKLEGVKQTRTDNPDLLDTL